MRYKLDRELAPAMAALAAQAAGAPRRAAETALTFTIFEGTSEIQRMIIGRAVTGLDVR